MSTLRRDNGTSRVSLPTRFQQLWGGRSSSLTQHEIDTIYASEYGEPTQQDCNDFLLLFIGLHQDMMELQQELIENTIGGGAEAMAIAPCLFGRLNVIMDDRVTAVASGKPIFVKGLPSTIPGRMMSNWASDYVAGVPSLYDRLEGVLAAQAQQSLAEASNTAASTSLSASLSATHVQGEAITKDPKKARKKGNLGRDQARQAAWMKSRK